MKIINIVSSKGKTGFYFDDQRAIKKGAIQDGATYHGSPVTEGFSSIRQAGESLSIMIVLEDGQIAYGDCAAVQYSGAGGRDPLFLADTYQIVIENEIKPLLLGKSLEAFRPLAEAVDHYVSAVTGKVLHTAIRYGVTQAILDAVAKSKHKLMCEIIEDEYGLIGTEVEIPIFMQSGDDRYNNVDKMIMKEAHVLPHGLINHVDTKLGYKGEKLLDYVKWLRDRICEVRSDETYMPVIHLDVYGTIGIAFHQDETAIVDYLQKLEEVAKPFKIRIEGPTDLEEREAQMLSLKSLTEKVNTRGMKLEIVADEWCNTLEDIRYFADNQAGHMIQIKTPDLGGIQNIVEAVLYCKEKGVGAYQGGTCNETDRSAQICVHLAMATTPDQILAKPGMGVDEGFMIVYNEMQRILALKKAMKN